MTLSLASDSARLIVAECKQQGLLRNECAYVLATAKHESGNFRYMREIWGPTAAQKRYEGRADLGNVQKGDGKKFLGRGFAQITGRRNYQDWSRRLGLDLLKEPQLAERPEIAVRILAEGMKLGTFTGKKLSDFMTLTRSDYVGARKIINGTDKADLIAGYAKQYDVLLKAAGYGAETVRPIPAAPVEPPKPATPIPVPPEPTITPTPPAGRAKGICALIIAALLGAWLWIATRPCEWLGLFCGG